jgi:hypothetical protein
MRRGWVVLIDAMCFALMASCVTVREEVVVRRDLSGSYTLEQVWDLKAVREEIDEAQWEESVKEAEAKRPEWVRFEREKTKDKDIHRYSFEFADLQDLRKKCRESDAFAFIVRDLRWQKKGWTLTCTGKVELGGANAGIGPQSEDITDSITLRLTMPGGIRRTNADKVAGRTVEWVWKGGAKEVEVTSWLLPPVWVFAAVGVGVVVVVGGAVCAVRRVKRGRVKPTEAARDEPGDKNHPHPTSP